MWFSTSTYHTVAAMLLDGVVPAITTIVSQLRCYLKRYLDLDLHLDLNLDLNLDLPERSDGSGPRPTVMPR